MFILFHIAGIMDVLRNFGGYAEMKTEINSFHWNFFAFHIGGNRFIYFYVFFIIFSKLE